MLENPTIAITMGGELIALAAATGAAIGDVWMLPAPASAGPQLLLAKLRVTLWRLLGLGALVFALAAAAELVLRTASMSELPLRQAFSEIGTVLAKTHYGQLWLWRAAALLGLAATWLIRRRYSAPRILPVGALAALVVMVISLSASGHAGDDGLLSMANIANSLHILGALLWGGGIIAFALVILPMMSRDQEPNQALIAVSSLRLSTLAGIALALTVLPGIYNALTLVGTWHELGATLYGQLLAAKIILVAGMIALGAVNRYRYVPSLQVQAGRPPPRSLIPLPRCLRSAEDTASAGYFLRSLQVEALLLLAVLSLAAALSQQVPAAHAEHDSMSDHAHAGPSR